MRRDPSLKGKRSLSEDDEVGGRAVRKEHFRAQKDTHPTAYNTSRTCLTFLLRVQFDPHRLTVNVREGHCIYITL